MCHVHSNENRVEYVGLYVRWVLETSIALQVRFSVKAP